MAEPTIGDEFLENLDKRIAAARASDDPARQAHAARLEYMRPFLRTRALVDPEGFSERVDFVLRQMGFDYPKDGADDLGTLD